MGFLLDFIPFFDAVHAVVPLQSPFLAIGSQGIHDPAEAIRAYAGENGYAELAATLSLSSFLGERYGIDEYADMDANDSAAIKVDLTGPLPPELCARWRAVYNGGTLEHIYDVAAAMANLHRLLAPGGVIIHASPISWLSHGYYNFTPRMLADAAAVNGYDTLAEGWHFRPPAGGNGALARLFFPEGRSRLLVTRVGENETEDGRHVRGMLAEGVIPLDTLYFAAFRKRIDLPFRAPREIYD